MGYYQPITKLHVQQAGVEVKLSGTRYIENMVEKKNLSQTNWEATDSFSSSNQGKKK